MKGYEDNHQLCRPVVYRPYRIAEGKVECNIFDRNKRMIYRRHVEKKHCDARYRQQYIQKKRNTAETVG